MTPFLQKLVDEIRSRPRPPEDYTVVFQTRRAGLYFKSFFAKSSKGTSRLPEVLSIEDFVFRLCPLKVITPSDLLFEFYDVYRKRENSDSFESFTGWASTLLKDFDDIDSYMAPPHKLLEYIRNLQSMKVWSPGSGPTALQKRYLEFWEEIPVWYDTLRDHLLNRKLAYKGMAFRTAAETIATGAETLKTFTLFAGFNALSVSEMKILKHLLRAEKADIFWDIDRYYFDDPMREAGHFFRQYIKDGLTKMEWQVDDFAGIPKCVDIIGTAQNIGQVRVAVQTLNSMKSLDSTAIVLADENLLNPLLHHLPDSLGPFNISMGMRLSSSVLAAFVKNLFDLHVGAVEGKFYHANIDALITGPYAADLLPFEDIRKIRALMREQQLVWVHPIVWQEIIQSTVLEKVFTPWQSAEDAFDGLQFVIEILRETWIEHNRTPIDLEYLFQFSGMINRLRIQFSQSSMEAALSFLYRLIEELMHSVRVPFSGEPLVGLQIMGILETRSLDFDNVIVLGVNENILPLAKHQPSMIPFEARRWAGLPTHSERDAIYAYNFYRLLQRASTITLVYNTESDEFGRGEISRFVTQLIHEPPVANPVHQIQHRIALTPVGPSRSETAITIVKDAPVLEILRKRASDGLSPSAMREYVSCEFRFYLKYVAGLREQDEIEETVESSTIGNAVHAVLYDAFKPLLGQTPTQSWMALQEDQSHPALLRAFKNELVHSLETGKNKLIFDFSVEMLREFWKSEADRLGAHPVRVVAVEHDAETTLNIRTQDGPLPVKVKGRIDRIDEENDRVRVIDYKTGNVKPLTFKRSELSELLQDPELAIALQLMIYALAYHDSSGKDNIVPSVYWLRTSPPELKGIANQDSIDDFVMDRTTLEGFRSVLTSLLESLFDTSKPFVQTVDEKRCAYCPFTVVCNRSGKESKF